MTIEVLISFVDRDSLTGKLTSYAQGDVVRNLSDEVANAFIGAGLAKAYTNLGVAGNISITANGQYDVADYASATVNVGSGGSNVVKSLVERTITNVTADMLEGVTSIGNYAFVMLDSLESIEIPGSVTSIGAASFMNCSNLANVTIGNGITSIGEGAFEQCSKLTSITVLATTPPILGSSPFGASVEGLAFYVPAESVDTYKAAENWSSYASKIQAIPSD